MMKRPPGRGSRRSPATLKRSLDKLDAMKAYCEDKVCAQLLHVAVCARHTCSSPWRLDCCHPPTRSQTSCRRSALVGYFGEVAHGDVCCGTCDNCGMLSAQAASWVKSGAPLPSERRGAVNPSLPAGASRATVQPSSTPGAPSMSGAVRSRAVRLQQQAAAAGRVHGTAAMAAPPPKRPREPPQTAVQNFFHKQPRNSLAAAVSSRLVPPAKPAPASSAGSASGSSHSHQRKMLVLLDSSSDSDVSEH